MKKLYLSLVAPGRPWSPLVAPGRPWSPLVALIVVAVVGVIGYQYRVVYWPN